MTRTVNISIGVDAYDDETEQDRLEYQSKILNMFIDFCRDNIEGYMGIGCTVKDPDFSGRYLNMPRKYKYKHSDDYDLEDFK